MKNFALFWVGISVVPCLFFPLPYSSAQDQNEVQVDFAVQLGVANQGGVAIGFPFSKREQIEEYIYASIGGSKAAFHKLSREAVLRELARVDNVCQLTESQWSKLHSAIEADIEQIDNRITTFLSGYDEAPTVPQLQRMNSDLWPFVASLGHDSQIKNGVWKKVLKSQLTVEQSKKLEADDALLAKNKARTDQSLVLLMLNRRLGLNAAQRKKISDWLKSQEAPINFDQAIVQLDTTPELRDILNERQKLLIVPLPPDQAMPMPMPMQQELFFEVLR